MAEEFSTTNAPKRVAYRNQLLQLNRVVLRMLVQHESLNAILTELCLGVEELVDGMIASILLLDNASQRLYSMAGPNVPKPLLKVTDNGLKIGPKVGCCGAAAYYGKQVLVDDMTQNPLWEDYQDLVNQVNLKTCWSTPVMNADGEVLGTFAMYFEDSKMPIADYYEIMELAIDLAGIAIQQQQYAARLNIISQQYKQQNEILSTTKQQLEEDKLRLEQSEQALKEAQEIAKVGSWELNFESKELIWSDQQYRMFEINKMPPKALYQAYFERIHPEDRVALQQTLEEASQRQSSFEYQYRIISSNGIIKYMLGRGSIFLDPITGQSIGAKGIDQDITALKTAQDSAAENELIFNELMTNINEIVFTVDLKNNSKYDNPITYINGDTLRIFGYTHQELIEVPILWTDRIHPDDLEQVMQESAKLHQTNQQVIREYRFKHKTGHYVWIEDNISKDLSKDGNMYRLYGSARDITERKRSEKALIESAERLKMATQAAQLGSYDWKVGENELYWDQEMYRLFGYDSNEDISKSDHFKNVIHPDDHERVTAAFSPEKLFKSGRTRLKDEYRITIGEQERYIETHAITMLDQKGNVERIIGTCLDVTERKQAEALLISNEEKDILLKEIHHRVKNNLQVITSLLSLQSSMLDHEHKDLFSDSQYRINSMAIVHELLYQSDDLSKLNYKRYLEALSQDLIRSMKGNDSEIDLELNIPPLKLSMDTAIPLGLLINEVLTNSLKYGFPTSNKGEISIRIRPFEEEGLNDAFLLEIGDNGIGYSTDITFYNTSSLGLKLIKNLTRQLEGRIKRDLTKKGTNYQIMFREIGNNSN